MASDDKQVIVDGVVREDTQKTGILLSDFPA